jgi:hypothetical protein
LWSVPNPAEPLLRSGFQKKYKFLKRIPLDFVTITVSIGAASLKQNKPQEPDNLFHLADRMLAGYKLAVLLK